MTTSQTARELRDIDDTIAALVAYRASVETCGYDRGYAITDKAMVYEAVARLTGSDEVAEFAANIRAEIEGPSREDMLANAADARRKIALECAA